MAEASGSSEAPAAPRKKRIVAIHGGASNSNIMKFQTGPLRKLLGNDAEWLFPDGPVPWLPASQVSDPDVVDNIKKDQGLAIYYADRSPFEVRLAQGQPFASWFHIVSDGTKPIPEPASIEASIERLVEYLESVLPIDAVVTFSQGNIVCNAALMRMMGRGHDLPWQVYIGFSPTMFPTALQEEFDIFGRRFKPAAFLVSSPLDPSYEYTKIAWGALFEEGILLEHQDGLGFPVRPPTSTEIYERLSSEIRSRCDLAAPVQPSLQERRRDWQARVAKYRSAEQQKATGSGAAAAAVGAAAGASAPSGAPVAEDSSSEEEEEDGREQGTRRVVEEVDMEALAQMLRDRACVLLDIENCRRSLPAIITEDLSFVTLRMVAVQAKGPLKRLREGGQRVVVASRVGDECQEYAAWLVQKHEFKAEQLCTLEGGFRSWDTWELENPDASLELRKLYSLPPLRGSGAEAISAEALAELLLVKACVVADVREKEEVRRRAFPGAAKDVSLLMLTKRPHQVRRKVEALRDDGRPLVAVSGTGLRCRRYCSVLVDDFGFEADKVCWLEGGACRWEEWEQENSARSDEIRALFDMPPARSRAPDEGRTAKQREHSLDLLV